MLLTSKVAKLLSVQSQRGLSMDVKKGHDKTEDFFSGYKRYVLCILMQSIGDQLSCCCQPLSDVTDRILGAVRIS